MYAYVERILGSINIVSFGFQPKLSASLAYYTIFTIGPMLLIIMFISRTFWGSEAIEGKIYNQIKGMVGDGPALQIQEIIKNATITGNDFTAFVSVGDTENRSHYGFY